MKRLLVLLALCALSCTTPERTTYEDVCHTVRQVCTVADALCFFAPKVARVDSTARAKQVQDILHQLDSLTEVLHKQLEDR